MAEGLEPNLYNHFVGLLWGNGDSAYLSKVDSSVDSEWESFKFLLVKSPNYKFLLIKFIY